MPSIFVTGTGTDVGKTFFCTILLKEAEKIGLKTAYFKPVATGVENPKSGNHDVNYISKYVKTKTHNLYTFKKPISPHLCSRKIDLEKILRVKKNLERETDLLVLEGVGGILVPLSTNSNKIITFANLCAKENIPTIIVGSSYLGSINHTLLTVEYLRSKKINMLGFILNYVRKPVSLAEKLNKKALKDILQKDFLGYIPYQKEPQKAAIKWEAIFNKKVVY